MFCVNVCSDESLSENLLGLIAAMISPAHLVSFELLRIHFSYIILGKIALMQVIWHVARHFFVEVKCLSSVLCHSHRGTFICVG